MTDVRRSPVRRSGRWVRQVKIPVPSSKCQMLGAQCTASVQELYPMRAGAVVHRPCWFHEERGPRIARITRIRGGASRRAGKQRATARRGTTGNGELVLWVRRVYAMASWIEAWIWSMMPVTAESEPVWKVRCGWIGGANGWMQGRRSEAYSGIC